MYQLEEGKEKLLQIGTFSKICQVSIKTMRHYDKIGLLSPAEVDCSSGYRYYRLEQIDTMNYIQRLKRYGFSLEEIQKIISFSDATEISAAFRRQREKIRQQQQERSRILDELQSHICELERTGDVMAYQKDYQIQIKESPRMYALSVRSVMSAHEFGKYYGKLYERVPKEHVTPTGMNGTRYYDEDCEQEEMDAEVFIGISEKEKADIILEPTKCAMTVHRGPYSSLSEAYGALLHWTMENGYEVAGAFFELYMKTQFDSFSPDDWETEVYFPVKKK